MTDGAAAIKPQIIVYGLTHPGVGAKKREVRAGMEEEGIPCLFVDKESGEIAALAFEAACASQLGVGIALGAQDICIHFQRLRPEAPLFQLSGGTTEQWRRMGCNAARLVKGIPFKSTEEPIGSEGHPKTETQTDLTERILQALLKELQSGAWEVKR